MLWSVITRGTLFMLKASRNRFISVEPDIIGVKVNRCTSQQLTLNKNTLQVFYTADCNELHHELLVPFSDIDPYCLKLHKRVQLLSLSWSKYQACVEWRRHRLLRFTMVIALQIKSFLHVYCNLYVFSIVIVDDSTISNICFSSIFSVPHSGQFCNLLASRPTTTCQIWNPTRRIVTLLFKKIKKHLQSCAQPINVVFQVDELAWLFGHIVNWSQKTVLSQPIDDVAWKHTPRAAVRSHYGLAADLVLQSRNISGPSRLITVDKLIFRKLNATEVYEQVSSWVSVLTSSWRKHLSVLYGFRQIWISESRHWCLRNLVI